MKYNKVLASLIVLLSLLMLFVLPFAFLIVFPEWNTKLFFIIKMPSLIGSDIKIMSELGNEFWDYAPLFIMRIAFFVSYILFNVFGVVCIYKVLKNKKSISMLKIMLVMLFVMIITYVYNAEDGMGCFAVPVGCVASLILINITVVLERKKNGCIINYKYIILQTILLANMMVPIAGRNYSDELFVHEFEWFGVSFFLASPLALFMQNLLTGAFSVFICSCIFLSIILIAVLILNIHVLSYSISDGKTKENKRKSLFIYGINIIIYICCFVLFTIVIDSGFYLVGLHIFALVSVIGFIMALIDIRKDKIKSIDMQNQ